MSEPTRADFAYVESERDHFAQVARDTFQELKAITAERDAYAVRLGDALSRLDSTTGETIADAAATESGSPEIDARQRAAIEAKALRDAARDWQVAWYWPLGATTWLRRRAHLIETRVIPSAETEDPSYTAEIQARTGDAE